MPNGDENLVASDWFGRLFSGRSNADRLVGVREIRRDGFGDVRDAANLDDGRLRLFENEFFVDGADLGGFLPCLLAAYAVFFGRGQRNVVLEVANAGCVLRVNLERVFVALEIDTLALGIDLVLAVGLVPFGDGGVLLCVFNDLAPPDVRVRGSDPDFGVWGGARGVTRSGSGE